MRRYVSVCRVHGVSMNCQGALRKSQEEGQEEQGKVKELGGLPLAVLRSPGPLSLPLALPCAPWNSLKVARNIQKTKMPKPLET